VGVEFSSVTEFAKALGGVPKELRSEMRPALKASADHVVNDMKSNASWSTRIPGAIRSRVSFAQSGGGVKITVDQKRAPHARVLEGLTARGGTFRHPVFGNRDVWVSQASRPYFFPAVRAGRDQLRRNITDAVRASLRKATG
jgi:hypothetical protein